MPTLTANGLRIAFDTAGDAKSTPVLLLHGLGMQLTSWPDEFVEGLVELGFYVIRFDHRDCGLSTKFDRAGKPNLWWSWLKSRLKLPLRPAYRLEDLAEDALGVLSALGVAKAHVVGVSMGGMVAQILAAQHPQRVLSLTSIMSSSGRRGLPGPSHAARQALLRRPASPNDIESLIDQAVALQQAIGSPAYPTPEKHLRRRAARPCGAAIVRPGPCARCWRWPRQATAAPCCSRLRCRPWSSTAPATPGAAGLRRGRRGPGAGSASRGHRRHGARPASPAERTLAYLDRLPCAG
ncbi:alpha/beta fold hydrolase [Massilia sp. Dwa41.01b]|uniref:alpha/beta fold hydrolase n=1 Tax=Massilia sp. Dwa41.01b TaxID=2709302 RepID=UPI001E508F49|nr:alpha/beta fold hydrolase [Massilia sp. Dwa41.01b]